MTNSKERERRLVLHYSPGACSLAAHIVLQEMGLPFELHRVVIADGEHLKPDYLAINPRGRIPTLTVDDKPIRELSGILMWLGQQGSLALPNGSVELARCGEWLGWLTSSVHISFALVWRGGRFSDEPEVHTALRRHGLSLLEQHFSEIEADLSGPFALGEKYSVVDPNLLVFYRWGRRVGIDMEKYPRWSGHTARMLKRDAVRKALAAENTEIYAAPDTWTSTLGPGLTRQDLQVFGDAWARGDVDLLMSMMDVDCSYGASVGPDPGTTYVGQSAVRRGFEQMLDHDAGAIRVAGPTWVIGNVAFSKWAFEYRTDDGGVDFVVEGIDHFEIAGAKIRHKGGYRKTFGSLRE